MELNLVSSVSLLLFALSAAYVYYTMRGSKSPRRLPPAPPGWPVIGHLHLLTDMPHHALAELAKAMRAPLLRLQLGSIPAIVISKPDLARAALTSNDAALASRPHLLSGQFLSFGCSDVTFAPAGPYHRMARRVVVSELLSARQVATYGRVRGKELRRLLAHLTKNTTPGAPVDLSECFLNLANDVLCRVAFGRRFPHGKGDKLGAVLAEAQDLFAGFTIGDFFPELEPVASTVTGLRRRLKSCLAKDLGFKMQNISVLTEMDEIRKFRTGFQPKKFVRFNCFSGLSEMDEFHRISGISGRIPNPCAWPTSAPSATRSWTSASLASASASRATAMRISSTSSSASRSPPTSRSPSPTTTSKRLSWTCSSPARTRRSQRWSG